MRFLLPFLVAGFVAATPAAAQVTLPLEPYLGVLWSFQAKDGGRYLLDTAGGLTAITPATATKIGCQPWGRITGHRMRGDRVDLTRCDKVVIEAAGAKLAVATAGVFDFAKLLPPNAPTLEGSVALDAFAGQVVTLDLGGQALVVETPASLKARIKGAQEVPVRFARDAGGLALTPFVPVETPKGAVWMELDSGSNGAVVVAQHNAALFGMNPDSQERQPVVLSIQGGPKVQTQGLVMDLVIDGNIGAPLLKDWIVTLDLANTRAWIKAR
uniref:hypothetical protein n=1 Tax=uncultured Caulobacter sp. TaxID=158749 RepID=UPI0025FE64C1|nr:hypothetical protein [uncultured Caulobacter sp.]